MTTTLANKQFLNGINASSSPGLVYTPSSKAAPDFSPGAAHKLPEGWHNTEKYGEVFVSPGGIAWVVQLVGSKLESVAVQLSPSDIIGKGAVEKRKDAIQKAVRRQSIRVLRTKPPILTPSVVGVATDGVSEGNK
jgi:hypothetical protein